MRAYSKAVKDTLDIAEKFLMVPGNIILAKCEYSLFDRFERVMTDFDADVISSEFLDYVNIEFSISEFKTDEFIATVNEKLSSRVYCDIIGKKYTKEKIL